MKKNDKFMIHSEIPGIVKERVINDKVWQIISFFENGVEKFDVVYFDQLNVDEMKKELISSKKNFKTFESIEEALKFLKELV